MIRNRKRLWALLLSAALIVTQLPAVAMAENATPEDGSIASFEELPSGVANQTVDVGTELSGLNLPDTVTASVYHVTEDMVIPDEDDSDGDSTEESDDPATASPSDAENSVSEGNAGDSSVKDSGKVVTTVTTSKEEIPVSWDSEPAYDGNTEGKYVFMADVGGYALSGSAKLPKITVTVAADTVEKPTESQPGEPILCTQTEGCTLPDGHEGDCVPAPPSNDSLIKTITGWTFVDDENLNEGVLPLINVNMEQQADFDTVVSMLPTQISADIEGEADPATMNITDWTCPEYIQDGNGNWPLTGEHTFTAALPEGYACEPFPTVKVLLGGAELYASAGDFTVTGGELNSDYTYSNNTLTINTSTPMTISGITSTDKILVPDGVIANLTLSSVNIDVSKTDSACAFAVEAGGTANITLSSDAYLQSGNTRAGLEVPENAEVTISGDGNRSLKAYSNGSGAGIGGSENSSGGTITIGGYVSVTAVSNNSGAGIGGGKNGGGGTITIKDHAAVNAISNKTGTGIGGGENGSGGIVNISGADTKVIATGQPDSYDVGSGVNNSNSGSLSVTDGAVLKMLKSGTNVATPEYKNCTIIDGAGKSTVYDSNGNPIVDVGDFSVSDGELGTDYTYENNTLTIHTSKPLTISGRTSTDKILVPDGVTANVTVSGVNINVSGTGDACAFAVEAGGTANITLQGKNTLASGQKRAGLEVPENATVTIDGGDTDELTATGGAGGAGIGGNRAKVDPDSMRGDDGISGGTITIRGGKVKATGGNTAAGIGGGGGPESGGSGGYITIIGGEVEATGGSNGAGIGGGEATVTGGSGGTIDISGGKVKATGGYSGAGIGGGDCGSGGNITISGGEVEATGGNSGAGIGGGKNNPGGNITISGGTTKATGGKNGAGIGGGHITISGGTTTATGKDDGAGIGGGRMGDGGTVEISGSGTSVTAQSTNGYDVGSGTKYLDDLWGGSLTVTDGATLKLAESGTNVTDPVYINCTIIDKDDNRTTYPSKTPALSLTADPENTLTLPGTVTLTATLSDAYPDNTGKTIIFTVNGSQHGTAITNDSGVATYSIANPSQGGYTFDASFAGDTLNTQATAAQISGYAVGLGTQAALGITGLGSAYTYGSEAFKLSTSGGSGSGAVDFLSSEPSIASVTGNTVTIQKAGTFTITATKASDSHYAEAKVTSHAVTVHSATPNMSLTASGGSTTSDPLTLTATVSKVGNGVTPAGTVTFKVGDKTLHSDSLDGDGNAVYTISNPEAGSHVYTVEYSGQTGYYNKTSTARTIGVGLTDQTGFTITDPGEKTYGDGNFTLMASGGQSTGGVSFSVTSGNGVLAVAADGSVKITGAGKATVTALKDGDSKYNQATATLEITVKPRDISNVTVNVMGSHVYTGSQLQPGFEVYDGGNAITTGDYTNSYGTNVAVGTGAGSITLTGQRNYTGTKTVQFDIEKRSLNSAVITLEASSYPYTGSEIKPAVTNVVVDGITVPAAEYDVGYSANKDAGTATVTITAKTDGNFSGSASTTFTITKADTPSGGGGGGNSSNSSNESSVTTQTPQPTADDPNPPTVGKITPTATVDKDGKVTVSVSDRDIQSAIDKATAQARKDGTLANGIAVSIDLTGLKTQFNTLPLTLSRAVYQKLVDAGVSYISIVTPQISLSLDLETLKTIYTNATGNVTINAVKAENSKLPAGMQNRPAYDLTIVSGGKQISDFGKGNIAVTLPYTLQGTEQGGNLQMAYVDTEGKARNMTNSSYHENQSAMIGRTNHFTVFGIVQKPAPAFKDIEGHWANDDILFVASRELLFGTGNNLFSPDTGMTRGMFVTALGRLAGIDQTQYKNTKFSDVAATAYYAPYVAWAAEQGIVNGTTDTTFAPDIIISREQMAVIMQNYALACGYTVPKTREAMTFADNGSIELWAKDAVKAMQMAGVMNGKDGNRFDPKASATRAEVAAVLRRFVEIVINPATAVGWEKNNSGHWLYYKDGKALIGWQTIGRLRYYFNGDGVMHEDWKQDTGTNKWYYWTNAGAATGWKEIGGKWYYFDENGVLAVNTKIDGYEVGPDGARK